MNIPQPKGVLLIMNNSNLPGIKVLTNISKLFKRQSVFRIQLVICLEWKVAGTDGLHLSDFTQDPKRKKS